MMLPMPRQPDRRHRAEVGVFEAKTTLSKLLERVARGETIVITRHGKAVARLAPPGTDLSGERIDAAVATIERLAGSLSLPAGTSLQDLIAEGRK